MAVGRFSGLGHGVGKGLFHLLDVASQGGCLSAMTAFVSIAVGAALELDRGPHLLPFSVDRKVDTDNHDISCFARPSTPYAEPTCLNMALRIFACGRCRARMHALAGLPAPISNGSPL